jgi:alpha-galactosidase-like CBM13-containing protein/VCBS repeat protein
MARIARTGGHRPREKFRRFQKRLDAISCFAAKGCSPDDVYTCTRDVRKQINPSVKAQLLRNALILLSLVTFNQDIFCQTPTPTATATTTPTPTPTATPSPTATECQRPTPGVCTSYEAESDNNTLTGSAFILSCPTCSDGLKVGYVGSNSGTLQFNGVGVVAPGNHTVTICYLNGDAVRYALLSVNGGQGIPVSFPSTGSFQTLGSIQITVTLNTGCNTLEFYNPIVGDWAPDFDRIQFNCPTCTVSAPSPTPTPTPRPSPTTPAVSDFNRDGHPDYLLFNSTSHGTVIWYMNNNVHFSGNHGPALPAGWNIAAVADFNGDDYPDYLLFNANTRRTVIFYMRNNVHIGSASGPTPPAGWTVVATADFNRDGHPDYLLFNPTSRATVIWYMNNNVRIGAAPGPTIPAGWNVVGLADFNGDAYADYLLFNATTRGTVIFYMRNNVHIGSASGPISPAGWTVAGTADFNKDGHPDYLLFNPTSRATVIWYMNNNVRIGAAPGPTLPAGWNVVGQ